MDAEQAREGLAERRDRARRLRAAWEAALLDRDIFAVAVRSSGVLPTHEIGSYVSDSDAHDYRRTRVASIAETLPERVRKFRERHPDIVITKY